MNVMDNGPTLLGHENLDKAINAHAGDREELDRQALEALRDMEYVRDNEPGELYYWEWY